MFCTRMVLWVAKAQITEQREGTLESQMLAPARRLPYLVGVGAAGADHHARSRSP